MNPTRGSQVSFNPNLPGWAYAPKAGFSGVLRRDNASSRAGALRKFRQAAASIEAAVTIAWALAPLVITITLWVIVSAA